MQGSGLVGFRIVKTVDVVEDGESVVEDDNKLEKRR